MGGEVQKASVQWCCWGRPLLMLPGFWGRAGTVWLFWILPPAVSPQEMMAPAGQSQRTGVVLCPDRQPCAGLPSPPGPSGAFLSLQLPEPCQPLTEAGQHSPAPAALQTRAVSPRTCSEQPTLSSSLHQATALHRAHSLYPGRHMSCSKNPGACTA